MPELFKPSSRHVSELDGIRGLAILMVIWAHSMVFEWSLVDLGHLGVVLFFCLSGFLITGILIDQRGNAHYFKSFWGRRIVRIFPLYYGFLVGVFLVLPRFAPASMTALHHEAQLQGWYWLYLQNLKFCLQAVPDFSVLSPLWSLAVEEQFYIFWPFVVFFFAPKRLHWACWALVILANCTRLIQVMAGANWTWSYFSLWSSVDSLAMGGLVAIYLRREALKPNRIKASIAVIVVLSVVLLGVIPFCDMFIAKVPFHLWLCLERTLGTFIGVAAIVLALILPVDSWWRRLLRWRFLRICGKYSYAMYIFHPLIILLIEKVLVRLGNRSGMDGQRENAWYVFPLTLALTIFVSWLSWNLYEKHFLKLKRYFSYDPLLVTPAAPPRA